MKIIKAKVMGFCFGVRRAIDMVERGAEEGPIASLGSVVHNPVVVDRLQRKGVRVVSSLEEVQEKAVAVTAHGRGPEIVAQARERGLRLIDATCPIVRKSQKVAHRLVEEGFKVIIYGEADHPEVKGVLAWTRGQGVAILDPQEEVEIPRRKAALLSQTTKSQASFAQFVAQFVARHIGRLNELRVINTTCPETDERYEAARELATQCHLIIVVGGKNSANTRKLAQTCRDAGVETYHVETAAELDPAWLVGKEVVGVTAGASTPDESIEEVVRRLAEIGEAMARPEALLALSGGKEP